MTMATIGINCFKATGTHRKNSSQNKQRNLSAVPRLRFDVSGTHGEALFWAWFVSPEWARVICDRLWSSCLNVEPKNARQVLHPHTALSLLLLCCAVPHPNLEKNREPQESISLNRRMVQPESYVSFSGLSPRMLSQFARIQRHQLIFLWRGTGAVLP